MLDIAMFSREYAVHKLTESDVEAIYELCQSNTLFYQYCEAEPTKEQILCDLHVTPPGVSEDRKYYVGFYRGNELIAVMDLIDGFPRKDIGFIVFFMVSISVQGNGVGSGIIAEVADYLKGTGKKSIQLGIDKGNPQSNSFWKKNGFQTVKEVDRDGGVILLSEKTL